MSETQTLTAIHVPTVYFIDDSATMREVIKIAFREGEHPCDHLPGCGFGARAIWRGGAGCGDHRCDYAR